jgi:hypothetical protein
MYRNRDYFGDGSVLFPQAIYIAIFDMYYDTYHDTFIGNCIYSLKSMLVDMGAAMFFLYDIYRLWKKCIVTPLVLEQTHTCGGINVSFFFKCQKIPRRT